MVMRRLQETFAVALGRAAQIRGQKQRQRGWKLYSWHAPETECIGKGKARAPYEFGAKVVDDTPFQLVSFSFGKGCCPVLSLRAQALPGILSLTIVGSHDPGPVTEPRPRQ